MGKKISNKEIEQYYFDNFAKQYSVPAGTIGYGDKPDITIKAGDQTIGIEITNFYIVDGVDPTNEQRQAPLREKVAKEAHWIYKTKGGKNIELSFDFHCIADINGLPQKIADFVRTIEDRESGSIWRQEFEHIPELAFVYLNEEEYDDPQWRVLLGFFDAYILVNTGQLLNATIEQHKVVH